MNYFDILIKIIEKHVNSFQNNKNQRLLFLGLTNDKQIEILQEFKKETNIELKFSSDWFFLKDILSIENINIIEQIYPFYKFNELDINKKNNKVQFKNELIENNTTPNIQIFENLLSEEECLELIEMYKTSINSTAGVMEINGTEINSKFRNANVNTDYYYKNSKVKNLIEKICKKINLPYKNLETPQIIEYPVGGYYLPHFDAFHNNLKNIDEIIKKIGNRKYTCIIYLNDNFIGGETVFPELNETIKPKTGNGLYFENIDNNGKILKTSLHAGLPVTEGIKYIIPLWFRENSY